MNNTDSDQKETGNGEQNGHVSFNGFIMRNWGKLSIVFACWLAWPGLIWVLHCARRAVVSWLDCDFSVPYLLEKYGQFGDMYGSFNALFAGIAFMGVLYASYLQRKEIDAQCQMRMEQLDELKRQKQNDTAERALKLIDRLVNKLNELEEDDNTSKIYDQWAALAYNVVNGKLKPYSECGDNEELKKNFNQWQALRRHWSYLCFTFFTICQYIDSIRNDVELKNYLLTQLPFPYMQEKRIKSIIVLISKSHTIDIYERGWSSRLGLSSSRNSFDDFAQSILNILKESNDYKDYLKDVSTAEAVKGINEFFAACHEK